MGSPLCDFTTRCQLADPTAGNCLSLNPPNALGCDPDSVVKVDAGTLGFSPSTAAACLAILADAGCDAAGLAAFGTVCTPTALVPGQGAPGTACDSDSDCLPVAIGPVGYGQYPFGNVCAFDTFSCAGTCSYGILLGQSCSNLPVAIFSQVGCAPGQGRCSPVSFDDAGSDSLCIPFVAVGQPCTDTGATAADCGGADAYCTDAGPVADGGTAMLCEPTAAAGATCDPTVCAANPAQCVCGQLACVPTSDPHTGVCQPAFGPNTPCVVGTPPDSCGLATGQQFASGVCIDYHAGTNRLFPDGGDGPLCFFSSFTAGLGEACVGGTIGPVVQCQIGLNCSSVTGTCVIPGVVGDACNFGDSYPCLDDPSDGNPSCQYAPDGGGTFCIPQVVVSTVGMPCGSGCEVFDYCSPAADGGSVCVPQQALGDACDVSLQGQTPCGDGVCVSAGDGGICQPTFPLGEPCAFDAECGSAASCSSFFSADGGSFCIADTCSD